MEKPVTIFVENRPHQVPGGRNLLDACLSLGLNLPYFCWHPALHSVGACRQCAVKQYKDEEDKKGRIVMACMTPAVDGTRISIDDPEARAFRAGVIEFLMTNHPHDCPVCDEGGECHLQDMTVMTGHNYRRYRFLKRTHRNQNLGPFVTHEMNRCIACYRCVRFYRDYAGGRDLDVFGAHNHVYFGRQKDGVLESEFSGNLVEVCPTGVFTDKTLAMHYTRKWDLQTAPSICVHCSIGCNTIPGERYGLLRRIRNRYNHDVNGYFLCDRGRYGYEFVNSAKRVRLPLLRQQPATDRQAFEHVASLLTERRKIIGIGSPRASLESNYALLRLVGEDRFYHGVSARDYQLTAAALSILRQGPARSPSLEEVATADAVFILGEDVNNTAPMLALALRQAARRKPLEQASKLKIPLWHDSAVRNLIQDQHSPFFIASLCPTRLDDVATQTFCAAPDGLARLGFAVAQEILSQPSRVDLAEMTPLARTIAGALKAASRPLIVCGTGCQSHALLQAAANVAWALCRDKHPAALSLVFPECNSLGLAIMGGQNIHSAFDSVKQGAADTVIILENDLFRRADPASVSAFLRTARHVVVLGSIVDWTAKNAEVVLPCATFAEADGTLVNNEGRAQRFYKVLAPESPVRESWRWLSELGMLGWQTFDEALASLSQSSPVLRELQSLGPPAGFRIDGQKIPRQSQRFSGRTAIHAAEDVHEPPPPPDTDSPLAFSMEGYGGMPPAQLIPRFWQPGWNSVQAVNKFQQEIGGVLKGGPMGVRLIEPNAVDTGEFFGLIPQMSARRPEEWLVVPLYHIFGSDELSALAPGIAELAPKPYLAMNPKDAAGQGLAEGMMAALVINGTVHPLPVKCLAGLPAGIAGLPAGLPDLSFINLPVWASVTKEPRG